MLTKSKLNIFLSTSNFVLCFVGFPLATSLFLPISSNIEDISRTVTVPYRAFALAFSLAVILLNIKKPTGKFPLALKVFLFYWGILIIRMIHDLYIRNDVILNDASKIWLYVFGICLPAVFSIIMSYNLIDLERAFRWTFGSIVIVLIMALFSNKNLLLSADVYNVRQNANLALGTITFGHLGVTGIILSVYALINMKLNTILRVIVILLIPFFIFITLRAGSRGPILSLLFVLYFWLFSRNKNFFRGLLILIVAFILTIIFMDKVLDFMGGISPVIEQRLRSSIYEGDIGNRDPFYTQAMNAFLESPILGEQFAIFQSDGSFGYSHNIFLDALMGLGIIGGFLMFYFIFSALKKSYFLIKNNDKVFWICLILIQQIMLNMVSGSFYYNQLLSALLTFVFLYYCQDETLNA